MDPGAASPAARCSAGGEGRRSAACRPLPARARLCRRGRPIRPQPRWGPPCRRQIGRRRRRRRRRWPRRRRIRRRAPRQGRPRGRGRWRPRRRRFLSGGVARCGSARRSARGGRCCCCRRRCWRVCGGCGRGAACRAVGGADQWPRRRRHARRRGRRGAFSRAAAAAPEAHPRDCLCLGGVPGRPPAPSSDAAGRRHGGRRPRVCGRRPLRHDHRGHAGGRRGAGVSRGRRLRARGDGAAPAARRRPVVAGAAGQCAAPRAGRRRARRGRGGGALPPPPHRQAGAAAAAGGHAPTRACVAACPHHGHARGARRRGCRHRRWPCRRRRALARRRR